MNKFEKWYNNIHVSLRALVVMVALFIVIALIGAIGAAIYMLIGEGGLFGCIVAGFIYLFILGIMTDDGSGWDY